MATPTAAGASALGVHDARRPRRDVSATRSSRPSDSGERQRFLVSSGAPAASVEPPERALGHNRMSTSARPELGRRRRAPAPLPTQPSPSAQRPRNRRRRGLACSTGRSASERARHTRPAAADGARSGATPIEARRVLERARSPRAARRRPGRRRSAFSRVGGACRRGRSDAPGIGERLGAVAAARRWSASAVCRCARAAA